MLFIELQKRPHILDLYKSEREDFSVDLIITTVSEHQKTYDGTVERHQNSKDELASINAWNIAEDKTIFSEKSESNMKVLKSKASDSSLIQVPIVNNIKVFPESDREILTKER